jgi:histidyl-tRNA synthetase
MAQEQTPQPVRGMNDVLPGEIALWHRLEDVARATFASYGYQELRAPIVKRTELFKRSIGEFTDIVEKEMYTFIDRSGDSLTLRPEGTAGIVRAMITNGLLHNQKSRVWLRGPMFRHERPQKGRFRQFHQIDVEAFGFAGPDIDAELIMMSARLWKELGIARLKLHLNSLGTPESRRAYRDKLLAYFNSHRSQLDEDSLRRLEGNPMRILDSKNPAMQDIVAAAPLLTEHLDPESEAHFRGLCRHLDAAGIEYVVNPRLVRGLDYYSRTVFEWITSELGSQDAVCSGGRYDGLVSHLGGDSTPAIGWALGEERIVALLQAQGITASGAVPDVYLVVVGERAEAQGLVLAERLRDAVNGIRIETHAGGGGFKSQLKRADKSGAHWALILGDGEAERGVAGLKSLRTEAPQIEVPLDELTTELAARIGREGREP